MAGGFDLSGAFQNPLAAIQLPSAPTGADREFHLRLQVVGSGGSEGDPIDLTGFAGQTIDFRRYTSAAIYGVDLRGDLTPFLPTAAAPDPPKLAFGLAFAQPGIGSFTLKPVPEPSTIILALAGLPLVLLARCRVLVRTAVLRSARISRPLATRRAF